MTVDEVSKLPANEPEATAECRYGGKATIFTTICQVHHQPKPVCEIDALRAVVRAYLRSPNRGHEERIRVAARRALKESNEP